MTGLLVSLFPSATLPWVNLSITEPALSLPSGNQTSVCLPKETIASLTLRVFSKPDSTRNTKSGVGAQLASAKCLSNQVSSRDDRMTGSLKLPFLDLSKACTYASVESPIDGYTGHMVGRMAVPLQIGFRFIHTLEGCRIAGLHIDAGDVPRIVVHRVLQTAVSVFHTSLLNIL